MKKQKNSEKAAKHILLVDDDADLVANHRAILEAAGYRVSAAYSAAEGRAALARQEPSLVVLDVMMETFEAGFDLAREIAGTRPQLPVLMLTGVDDHLSAEALAAQDRDGGWMPVRRFVEKPLDPAVLVDEIEHLLHESH